MDVEWEIRDLEEETSRLRGATSVRSANDRLSTWVLRGFAVGFAVGFVGMIWELWHAPLGMGGG